MAKTVASSAPTPQAKAVTIVAPLGEAGGYTPRTFDLSLAPEEAATLQRITAGLSDQGVTNGKQAIGWLLRNAR